MALITEFEQVTSDRHSVHAPVRCGWKIFRTKGSTVLQLDTYGTSGRDIPDKVSQSIQLDEAGAVALIGLIHRAFPNADRPR